MGRPDAAARPASPGTEDEAAVDSTRNAQLTRHVIDLREAPAGEQLLDDLRAAYDERLELLESDADDEELVASAVRIDALEARCRAPRPAPPRRRRSGPDPATFLG